MNIGERIKNKRLESNLTLEELGKRAKVSRATIQRYECGVISNIPSDRIELLAEALNTTPAFLLGWEERFPQKLSDNQYDQTTLDAIKLFNQLDELDKAKTIGYMQSLLDNK